MDAFHEFRAQSSTAAPYDAFADFIPNHNLASGDGFL